MKIFSKLLKCFLYVILILLSIELLIYFSVPIFDFPAPEPFFGNKFYNPYEGMDSAHWKKGNFHFHTRAWVGLTSGRRNSNQFFWETYKKLGYDVPCISNYQQISKFNKDSSFYIPTYEHGFGVRKKHQICIGAKKLLWLDYSLFQNQNHKQNILNLLKGQNELVAIAHPGWENGYPGEHLRILSNYDLLEVLDNNWRSVPLWDSALSSGHPVFILADDDAHDIYNPFEIGRCCTFINSPANQTSDLINALKTGRAFGADIFMGNEETIDMKAENSRHIPHLNSFSVRADTISFSISEKAMMIQFIGQNGLVRKNLWYTDRGFYKITPDDTYIRTEILFFNKELRPGTKFYLNPVFRYNGSNSTNTLKAEINWPRTWIFRIFSIPSLIVLVVLFVYIKRKKPFSKNHS